MARVRFPAPRAKSNYFDDHSCSVKDDVLIYPLYEFPFGSRHRSRHHVPVGEGRPTIGSIIGSISVIFVRGLWVATSEGPDRCGLESPFYSLLGVQFGSSRRSHLLSVAVGLDFGSRRDRVGLFLRPADKPP